MKKILAVAILILPMFAHAEPQVFAATENNAGGYNYLISGADKCAATGLALVAQRPFQDPVRGCVTRTDENTFHVFFENGLELDYSYAGWVKNDQPKKSKKGEL